ILCAGGLRKTLLTITDPPVKISHHASAIFQRFLGHLADPVKILRERRRCDPFAVKINQQEVSPNRRRSRSPDGPHQTSAAEQMRPSSVKSRVIVKAQLAGDKVPIHSD